MLVTQSMAERVRVKRAVDRLTMKDLAGKLGITYRTLSKIEAGDYDLRRAVYDKLTAWLDEEEGASL